MEAIRKIADIKVVHVHVDHSTLLKRLIARNEQRDSWKLANWHSYVKEVGNAKIQWNSALYTLLSFNNSDALPILYELKTNNWPKNCNYFERLNNDLQLEKLVV